MSTIKYIYILVNLALALINIIKGNYNKLLTIN
jgi:hypothetical protein